MIIGVPKEIKNNENRVGLTPAGVAELKKHGHKLFVQSTAGEGSGFSDEEYKAGGQKYCLILSRCIKQRDMIIKVKEPIAKEYPLIKKGQLLFTYFHFASSQELTEAMVKSGQYALLMKRLKNLTAPFPCLYP